MSEKVRLCLYFLPFRDPGIRCEQKSKRLRNEKIALFMSCKINSMLRNRLYFRFSDRWTETGPKTFIIWLQALYSYGYRLDRSFFGLRSSCHMQYSYLLRVCCLLYYCWLLVTSVSCPIQFSTRYGMSWNRRELIQSELHFTNNSEESKSSLMVLLPHCYISPAILLEKFGFCLNCFGNVVALF